MHILTVLSSLKSQSRDMGGPLRPPGLSPMVMGYSRISRVENDVVRFMLFLDFVVVFGFCGMVLVAVLIPVTVAVTAPVVFCCSCD